MAEAKVVKVEECPCPAGRPSWKHSWNYDRGEWEYTPDAKDDKRNREQIPPKYRQHYDAYRRSGLSPVEACRKFWQEIRDTTNPNQSYPHNM